MAVYKPAGLPTQTASVGRQDVVSELKNYIRQTENLTGKNRQSAPYLGVIHRLDQPVEGLLVFAKNPKAAAGLSAQLRKQEENAGFCKHYYAVIYGCPAEKSGELEDYLCKKDGRAEILECRPERQEVPDLDAAGRDSRAEAVEKTREKQDDAEAVSKRANRQPPNSNARKARLLYCILQMMDISEIAPADIGTEPGGVSQVGARTAQNAIALADIRLETGRFHQIRAQMAHGGMPLLGDLKYGSEESIVAGRKLNVRNVALCAYRLEFLHPVTGRKMDFHIKPKGEIFSLFSQF
ncbi:MAG TPA: RNA pseudouridine synthase [Lachnospiraceae bacterium]|nr:RNA pseudouridine synthase [Lachnospiraceae bacterium]